MPMLAACVASRQAGGERHYRVRLTPDSLRQIALAGGLMHEPDSFPASAERRSRRSRPGQQRSFAEAASSDSDSSPVSLPQVSTVGEPNAFVVHHFG